MESVRLAGKLFPPPDKPVGVVKSGGYFSIDPYHATTTMHNLFLIGYRGTGKTTVAQHVASRLGWKAVDADVLLEQTNQQTIRELFAEEGEAGFRTKETEVLKAICQGQQQVVATGGGVILQEENRALLHSSGQVVWLTADADTIWQRLQDDETTAERRPNLTVGGLPEIAELLAQREALYAECADWIVDTIDQTPEQVAARIFDHLWVKD